MPRQRSEQPKYGYHVSGQARVVLAGHEYYLGKFGSDESYAKYHALLAEYNSNGRQPPKRDKGTPEEAKYQLDEPTLIRDLVAEFEARRLPRYEHNNGQHNRFKNLCKLLAERYGNERPEDFGPRKLEALRDQFVDDGCSRKYVNQKVACIVQIFEFGVSRELVRVEQLVALRTLKSLKYGEAREAESRGKVSTEVIKATLPHLTPTAQAMVRLQLATAMRPSEIFKMTPSMIDRSGEVWMYRPHKHKTAHRGKRKAVPIVGEALTVLTPYLFGDPDELCFRTRIGTPWNKDSYRQAVTRAAAKAKVEHWTPYQLRHVAAQAVRDIAGPEAAQALLGHSRLSTTEIYAQANEAKAIEAAKVVPKLG